MPPPVAARQVKGANLVGLVKVLKSHRKKHPFGPLSPAAEDILNRHVLPTEWYPFAAHQELIDLTYRELLGSSEEAALKMGIAGGLEVLKGFHRGLVVPGDPGATLLVMRSAWSMYFNFGQLAAVRESASSVCFTLSDYPDITIVQGVLTVGWHVAAAIAAGGSAPRAEIIEAPWKGGAVLRHRVRFDGQPPAAPRGLRG